MTKPLIKMRDWELEFWALFCREATMVIRIIGVILALVGFWWHIVWIGVAILVTLAFLLTQYGKMAESYMDFEVYNDFVRQHG